MFISKAITGHWNLPFWRKNIFTLVPRAQGCDLWSLWHRISKILPRALLTSFLEMLHLIGTMVPPFQIWRDGLPKKNLINVWVPCESRGEDSALSVPFVSRKSGNRHSWNDHVRATLTPWEIRAVSLSQDSSLGIRQYSHGFYKPYMDVKPT